MFEVWESRAKEFQRRKWTVVTVRSDDHYVMIEGRYPTEAAADRRADALNRRKVLKRAA